MITFDFFTVLVCGDTFSGNNPAAAIMGFTAWMLGMKARLVLNRKRAAKLAGKR